MRELSVVFNVDPDRKKGYDDGTLFHQGRRDARDDERYENDALYRSGFDKAGEDADVFERRLYNWEKY